MDEAVQQALQQDGIVDITTIGRKTGLSRRIEIWFHYVDGRLFITGSPGPRGWYANLLANPEFTFHLKESLQRDIPARATSITDSEKRRDAFKRMYELEERMRGRDIEERVASAPLVEVELQA